MRLIPLNHNLVVRPVEHRTSDLLLKPRRTRGVVIAVADKLAGSVEPGDMVVFPLDAGIQINDELIVPYDRVIGFLAPGLEQRRHDAS